MEQKLILSEGRRKSIGDRGEPQETKKARDAACSSTQGRAKALPPRVSLASAHHSRVLAHNNCAISLSELDLSADILSQRVRPSTNQPVSLPSRLDVSLSLSLTLCPSQKSETKSHKHHEDHDNLRPCRMVSLCSTKLRLMNKTRTFA